jgi:hypothetical protein
MALAWPRELEGPDRTSGPQASAPTGGEYTPGLVCLTEQESAKKISKEQLAGLSLVL